MKQRHWCRVHKTWHTSHANVLCWLMHTLFLKNMKQAQNEYNVAIYNRQREVEEGL